LLYLLQAGLRHLLTSDELSVSVFVYSILVSSY
jgi:hypothetical protein